MIQNPNVLASYAMPLEQVPRQPLVDAVIEQLRNTITDGTYPPGAPLRQEELADALGISRTPLRQALIALARDGLVEEARHGFRVSQPSIQEALDLYEIRGALEGVAARMASERATPTDLERLVRAVEEGPVLALSANDPNDFHFVVGEIARCPALDRMRTATHAGTVLAHRTDVIEVSARRTASVAADEQASRAEHRAVYEAIAAGDGAEADRRMRAHFWQGRERLLTALEEGRLA